MRDWEDYLSKSLGEQVRAEPDASAIQRMSIGMGAIYAVYRGQLLDQAVRFIVPKNSGGPSLSDLLRHFQALRKSLDGELVFVLPAAKPYEIKRLVMERIPFVVTGRQVFLPRNLVFLRTSPSAGPERADVENPLSPRAQSLILFHLQKKALNGLTQIGIAGLLHWTPMTVSRVVQELQHKRLCRTLTRGRANSLAMARGHDLWESAEPSLTSPVRTRRFARLQKPDARSQFYDAGITALSNYTMLNEDPVPVLAIHDRAFSKLSRTGLVSVCPYREEGCVQVELWRYDPAPLVENKTVDRLSLYLSLKGDPDERVEGALRDLLEKISWQT